MNSSQQQQLHTSSQSQVNNTTGASISGLESESSPHFNTTLTTSATQASDIGGGASSFAKQKGSGVGTAHQLLPNGSFAGNNAAVSGLSRNNFGKLNEDKGDEFEQGDNEKKKKKKKNKNKKKKPTTGGQQNESSGPKSDTMFDLTSSLRERDRMTAAGYEDEVSQGKDFTPLKDKIGQSFFEDQDSSEDEGMPDYKIGGYHPVHVGEILLDRYVIIQKLGWGHFSTVWLTKDLKYNSYVAMKVQKSAQHYLEAAYDEVEILDQVATNWKTEEWKKSVEKFYEDDPQLKACLEEYGMSGDTSHCVQLLNSFIHHGPNGKHFVMVFEILGVNFLEIIKRYDYKGVPLPLVRKLTRQCLIGLDYMHRMCKIIHTDFKPENVVICLREDEVLEIAKTGQLTTTKMYEHQDIIKKINMKIAGTLPSIQPPASIAAPNASEEESKTQETSINPDGLTSKQRKNLKKKLQRKKKKQQQKDDDAASDDEEEESKKDPSKPAEVKMEASSTSASTKPESTSTSLQQPKKKPAAKKGSIDRNGVPDKQIGNLLNDDDELQNATTQQPGQVTSQIVNQKQSRRGPKIDENVMVKICDMGNGCWTYHHFTPEIQTRQYRSPEVIIGADYDTSADIWSLACTIFEMVTGDFLFEPRKGNNYDKDDDHLAQMMELLGRMPRNMALSGKHSKKYFNSQGHLRRISGLNYWPLKKVLMEKYRIKEEEAQALSDFLIPMLSWYPHKRATAQQMLSHPWLNLTANYEYKYTDKEYEIMMLKKDMKLTTGKSGGRGLDDSHQEMNELIESDEELNAADIEDILGGAAFNSSDEEGALGEGEEDEYDGYDADERSLVDSDEERDQMRRRKAKEAKINNSFTGPYPLDPTEFNHTDKGTQQPV